MTHPLESYLTGIQQIRSTGGGTAEESYYGPLENLLNDIGGKLKPKVRAIQQLKNLGSGEPDFGFYTADQFQRGEPIPGLGPERGAVEVNPWTEDALDVAIIRHVGGGQLDPQQGHLDLTAGWGYKGQGGVTMPGRGRIQEVSNGDDLFFNVYLNDHAYWSHIPAQVWEYTIGGYQVIKKWLRYRERPLLGRGLTLDEVEYVTQMARRLAALVLLRRELDANYRAVVGDTWSWPER